MNYLAIDTSGKHLCVYIGGDKTATVYIKDCSLNHSVVLMDAIEKCLHKANLELNDIDVFCSSIGPGSFTGIRIGVSTVKAFSYANDKKVLPITSFETLAYNTNVNKNKLCLISARHGNYYACGYDKNNKVILPPSFLTSDEIKKSSDKFVFICDEKTPEFKSKKANLKKGFIKAVQSKIDNATLDRETLIPLYVKKSQAEEEIK